MDSAFNFFSRDIIKAYIITFGWALVGGLALGFGLLIVMMFLKVAFWRVPFAQMIREANLPAAIFLSAIVIALGMVISTAVHP